MLVNVSNIFEEGMAVLLMQTSPVPISLNTTRPFGSKLLWAAYIAHYYEDVSELHIDYFMVGERVRFLFTSCGESQTNERIKIVHANQPWSNLFIIKALRYYNN